MPDVSEMTAVETTADASHASEQDTSVESVRESSTAVSAPRQEIAAVRENGRRSTKNPIPYEDHERVVDTFHQRLDALAWAAKLDREEVEEALYLRELANRDPNALVERLLPRTQQAPGPDREDGSYSEEQYLRRIRWENEQALKAYDSHLGKRLERLEGFVSRGEAVDTAQQQLARARHWPGFNDHIGEIADYVERANQLGQTVTLQDAYIDLVVPQLSTTSRREVIAELNDTAARTVDTINPARRASPVPSTDDERPLKDLLAEEFHKRERGGRGG